MWSVTFSESEAMQVILYPGRLSQMEIQFLICSNVRAAFSLILSTFKSQLVVVSAASQEDVGLCSPRQSQCYSTGYAKALSALSHTVATEGIGTKKKGSLNRVHITSIDFLT